MTREIWGALTEEERLKVAGRGARIVEIAEVGRRRDGSWAYVMRLPSGATWAKGDYPTRIAASDALDDILTPEPKPQGLRKPWISMTPPAGWRGMDCTCATFPTICPACQAWAANGFRE